MKIKNSRPIRTLGSYLAVSVSKRTFHFLLGFHFRSVVLIYFLDYFSAAESDAKKTAVSERYSSMYIYRFWLFF
ncbi:hypothetical protein O3M35_010752 [Rhynocoris fuscipes]|uniref:Uncharacterized protein n=1 Tax=Rhynocoris fuscipes TaxID=488301 RepID=A0AAW1D684_9HEMI